MVGQNKMAQSLQTTTSKAVASVEIIVFQLVFHWDSFFIFRFRTIYNKILWHLYNINILFRPQAVAMSPHYPRRKRVSTTWLIHDWFTNTDFPKTNRKHKLTHKFHWSLFLRIELTIFKHWCRWRLGAGQATNHYFNQWWLVKWRIYASLGLNELRDACRLAVVERYALPFYIN